MFRTMSSTCVKMCYKPCEMPVCSNVQHLTTISNRHRDVHSAPAHFKDSCQVSVYVVTSVIAVSVITEQVFQSRLRGQNEEGPISLVLTETKCRPLFDTQKAWLGWPVALILIRIYW